MRERQNTLSPHSYLVIEKQVQRAVASPPNHDSIVFFEVNIFEFRGKKGDKFHILFLIQLISNDHIVLNTLRKILQTLPDAVTEPLSHVGSFDIPRHLQLNADARHVILSDEFGPQQLVSTLSRAVAAIKSDSFR